jgi:hypothetical protein
MMIIKEKFEQKIGVLVVRSCDRHLLSNGEHCNIEMIDATRKITVAFFDSGHEGDILLVGDRFLGCDMNDFHTALEYMWEMYYQNNEDDDIDMSRKITVMVDDELKICADAIMKAQGETEQEVMELAHIDYIFKHIGMLEDRKYLLQAALELIDTYQYTKAVEAAQ